MNAASTAVEEQRGELAGEQELALWELVKERKDQAARHTLIEYYTFLAKRSAASLYAHRPDNEVEFADYMQYAVVGLIESVDRYDPSQKVPFSAFAKYRIRGSVLDGIEKLSERRMQISYRSRVRKERLESINQGKESSKKEDLFAEMVDLTISLAIGFMLEDSGIVQSHNKSTDDTAYREKNLAQVKHRLSTIVTELPERECLIIRYHYFYHVGFEELSDILNISKGRVSHLHKRALEQIRERLGGDEALDNYY